MTLIVSIKYFLWTYFFILQGRAIELAINKNKFSKILIYTLAGFILVKMTVMFCDIFQKFLLEIYKNIELNSQWRCQLPQNIYRDTQDKKNDLNVIFFDYLPKLFEFETALLQNRVVLVCVFLLASFAFIYTKFYTGIFALLLISLLNSFSKNIFVKKIDEHQTQSYHEKIKILRWIEQYFYSYRELAKNWKGINNISWKKSIYNNYYLSKKNQVAFIFYRDLLAQILIELPFLLNTSIVILGVYYEFLSLTQLFVWVGFSQFMINASNAYLENKIIKKQIDTLSDCTTSIINNFNTKKSKMINIYNPTDFLFSEVVMQDGEKNKLSLTPGLYRIKGGNGAGKSTLMNILLNYERLNYNFKCTHFTEFVSHINQSKVRVIDREALLLDCFKEFTTQICGPDSSHHGWVKPISHSLNRLQSAELATAWMSIFQGLEIKYIESKNINFSSGERVILSLMRFFCSWNTEVNLLIIDECDSFLDFKKKALFIRTISELAQHMAVYISCHDKL